LMVSSPKWHCLLYPFQFNIVDSHLSFLVLNDRTIANFKGRI
jgi:hypothetical protein